MRGMISIILSLILATGLFLHNGIIAKASDDVTASSYTEQDEEGNYVYHASTDGDTFNNVLVPDGCIFEISASVTISSLTINNGGRVIIAPDFTQGSTRYGNLNVTTITAEEGAKLEIGTQTDGQTPLSIPQGITLFNGVTGQQMTTDYAWKTFNYHIDPDTNQGSWLWFPDSKNLVIDLQGFGDNVNYTVYDGDDSLLEPVDGAGGARRTFAFDVNTAEQAIKVVISDNIGEGKFTYLQYNGSTISPSGHVSDDQKTITYTADLSTRNDNELFIMSAYENEGDPAIVGDVDDIIFAYAVTATDDTAVKNLLAEELYARFLNPPMYGRFEMPTENHDSCVAELKNRIAKTDGTDYTGSITCINNLGGNTTIYYKNYTVTWGHDSSGGVIKSTIPVYQLSSTQEILIKSGDTWYIRNTANDKVTFLSGGGEESLIISGAIPSADNVKVGGYGATLSIMNTQDICTGYINHLEAFCNIDGSLNGETILRFVNSSDTYVGICSADADDYLGTGGLGTNGIRYDFIWNTGNNGEEAVVFIGWKTVDIHSLDADTGVTTRLITNVELADDSLSDGVNITIDNQNNRATVEFLSNFYDEVPLTITYNDGTTRNITILRTGLVIQWQYLVDPENDGNCTDHIPMPLLQAGQIDVNYNYHNGEQILIYALYYHPRTDDTLSGSNNLTLCVHYSDGSMEFIDSTARYAGSNANNADTSFFILGFAPAKTLHEDGVWAEPEIRTQTFSKGSFYATVLNAGYDAADDGSFGGVQAGSGQGVYWDGQIYWTQH